MDYRTTVEQIGPMTLGAVGAREFQRGSNPDGTGYLAFKIGRGHRRVTVTLNATDTYDVQTRMIRSGRVVYDARGVYCDGLAEAVWQAHIERP